MPKLSIPEAQWKAQIAGETRARIAAEDRANKAEARAEFAERAYRELNLKVVEINGLLEELTAELMSRGIKS